MFQNAYTYHALSDPRRETHFVPWRFHLVEEIGAALEETEYSI
jgi:hypothetical protein